MPLVRTLALLQLGEKQQARDELAVAKQLLDSIKQQQQQQDEEGGNGQREGLEQVLEMYDRVTGHLAKCYYKDNCVDGCC